MPEIKQLFENNSKWSESIKAETPEYFAKLAKGQNPDFVDRMCRQPSASRTAHWPLLGGICPP